jgi:hypothetical protein
MANKILRILNIDYKKIKAFLSGKDALIFLFFLLLSFCFWYLQSLRKNYELTLPVKIEYSSIPVEYINEDELNNSSVEVTIKDAGYYLLYYKLNKIEPIVLDLSKTTTSDGNNLYVSSDVLQSNIKANLNNTANIVRTNPAQITIPIVEKSHKTLPVKHVGNITFAQQYTLSDSVKLEPKFVIAYGDKNILDTMQFAFTENANFDNLAVSANETINLKKTPSIQFNENKVNIHIPVEKFTEKVVDVPVVGRGFPKDMELITFPSTIKISFFVPFSKFNAVNANSFTAYIDFNKIENSETSAQKPTIESSNPFIFNVRIKPKEVGYLIEKQR